MYVVRYSTTVHIADLRLEVCRVEEELGDVPVALDEPPGGVDDLPVAHVGAVGHQRVVRVQQQGVVVVVVVVVVVLRVAAHAPGHAHAHAHAHAPSAAVPVAGAAVVVLHVP